MSPYCSTLVITCIDYRFVNAIHEYLKSEGITGNYDLVSVAGSSKDLAENDQYGRATIMKQIDIAVKLHKIKQLIIIHHTDCGAYAADNNFDSVEDEKKKHMADMEMSRRMIEYQHKELEIKKVLAVMDTSKGKPEITFELTM